MLVAVTLALGIADPLASSTVPVIVPEPACPMSWMASFSVIALGTVWINGTTHPPTCASESRVGGGAWAGNGDARTQRTTRTTTPPMVTFNLFTDSDIVTDLRPQSRNAKDAKNAKSEE